MNPELPVLALPEGAWIRVAGTAAELRGPHAATVFHGTKAPARLPPGPILHGL